MANAEDGQTLLNSNISDNFLQSSIVHRDKKSKKQLHFLLIAGANIPKRIL